MGFWDGLLGPDHAGTGQRHGTGQRKDSAGHTGAGGYGVADVRENASSKGGVGAESGGAADLPEDISCRRSLSQDNGGIARCRKRGPHLENVDTAAVEREGPGQLPVGPVFVTAEAPRTAKLCAEPRGGADCAQPRPPILNMQITNKSFFIQSSLAGLLFIVIVESTSSPKTDSYANR